MSQGIDVVLDKWDLQPGHDAHAFMESMVTDPSVTKVLLICDSAYARKSDGRTGGAGTEAQIISPELYANVKQDKFVAVVVERDEAGKPCVPTYYKSRIHFDLSDSASYTMEFDKIIRWAWGQPIHVKPTIGSKPSFLTDVDHGRIATSVAFRRATEALRTSNPTAPAAISEFLNVVVEGLEAFRIQTDRDNVEEFDERVLESIQAFRPYRDELIQIFLLAGNYNFSEEVMRLFHRFFESCIPYLHRPEHINQHFEWEFDNFRFIIHEAFIYLIGSMIKLERFDSASFMIDNEYYWSNPNGGSQMHGFPIFRNYLRSFDHRNKRLGLQRTSVHADLLKERNNGTGLEFRYMMAADFVLFLRGANSASWNGWWPDTLLYADRHGAALEMFARAKSARYLEKIMKLVGFSSAESLKAFLSEIPDSELPRWQFTRLSPKTLVGFNELGSMP
ncbi:hypothetical protein D3C71_513440 [compost metagenome]